MVCQYLELWSMRSNNNNNTDWLTNWPVNSQIHYTSMDASIRYVMLCYKKSATSTTNWHYACLTLPVWCCVVYSVQCYSVAAASVPHTGNNEWQWALQSANLIYKLPLLFHPVSVLCLSCLPVCRLSIWSVVSCLCLVVVLFDVFISTNVYMVLA